MLSQILSINLLKLFIRLSKIKIIVIINKEAIAKLIFNKILFKDEFYINYPHLCADIGV